MANADSVASRCISCLLPVLTIVSALAWNITASADDLQWSPDGVTPGGGGTGNWNTSGANVVWYNGVTFQAWNNVALDDAVFGGTAGIVTITGSVIAHDVDFDTTGYTINRTGANTLTLGGVTPTVSVVAAGTATINAPIAGTAGLTYAGPGTLILGQTNTYTGNTTISAGTLQIGNGTAGSISNSSNIVNDAALVFNRNGTGVTYSGVISGSGTLTKEGTNTLTLTGTNTFTGLTTINAGTLTVGGGTNGSIASDILNNSALIFNRSDPLTYGGAISGNGTVTKNGADILTLTGTNTYTGATTINTGTLQGGAENVFSAASAHTITSGDFLDLGGFGQTVGSITGSGRVTNSGVDAATLTTGADDTSTTFAGIIQDGTGGTSLTKTGTGTMTLTGANTYTGITTISDGTLEIGAGGTAGSIASLSIVNDAALIFNRSNAVTYSGVISGSGTLTKNGANTLTLTGDNTFSGLTTINTGTLRIGGGGTTGAIVGDIVNNSALRFDRSDALTYSGVISGAGTLTKAGAGTLTLSGVNTYTGNTTISGGAIAVSAEDNLGDLSSGLILGGGTLRYLTGFASDRGITLNSGGGTFNTNGNDATLGGTIGGTSTLTKTGAGILTLTGTNTYAGDTTISGGTLQLGDGGTTGSIVSDDVINNGELAFNRNDTMVFGAEITGTGTVTQAGTGTTVLTINNSFTGATTISAGTLQIGDGGTAGAVTSDIVNNAALVFNRSNAQTYTGDISGSGTLTKESANILTLTGDNTFTGLTTINTGTLQIGSGGAGSFVGDIQNNSALTFSRSGTLTYGGVIDGAGTVTKAGSGTVIFTGNHGYTGDTIISDGTLQLGDGGTSGSITGDVVNSEILTFNRGDTLTYGGVVSGAGVLRQIGTGTTILTGENTFTGDTTITAGTLQIGDGGATGSIADDIVNNAALVFDRNNTFEYDETISGTGTFTQAGTGTTILTGSSTYTGTTTISAGTLQIGNGAGTGSISSNSNIVNNAALVFNRTGATLTYGGDISGSGTLTKEGANTLTLTGDNIFTGLTTINAGTLVIGTGANGSFVGDIQNNSALTFSRTGTLIYGGDISGAGTVTKTEAGIVELTGTNTYTGDTTIINGTLRGGATNAFSAASAHILSVSGDFLDLGGFNQTIGSLAGTTGSVTNTGGSSATLTAGGNDSTTTFAGVIQNGTGGTALTKTGTGTMILTGTNTYTGITTISGGTLQIGANGTGGSISNNSNIVNDAALVFNRSNNTTYAGVISSTGTLTKTGGGTLSLTGDNTFTGLTTIDAGTLQIGNGGTTGSIVSDIVNDNALIFNRSDALSYGGIISSTGTLTKTGAGTLTLTGNNSHTGNTTVNAGTLLVNGTNANSAVTVGSGATLGGTGTVSTTVIQNGGTLAPGNSIGTININNNLTFASGSNYEVEFEPASNDLTNVAGIAFLAGTVSAIADPGAYAAGSYLILNATGGIDSTFADLDVQGSFGMGAKLTYDANNVFLLLGEVGWQGGTSTDWFTATNWDSGTVPTTSDTTVIDTVTPNPTVIAVAGAESGEIQIGNSATGEGRLTIQNGGTLDTTGNALVGQNGGDGEVVVTGNNSSWTVTGQLQLGGATGTEGDGRLTVENGATLTSNGASIFQTAGTDSRVLVTGAGSTWNSGALQIAGGTGFSSDHLAVEDGGSVTSGTVDLSGKARVTGLGSTWNIADDLTVGSISSTSGSVAIGLGATVNIGNGAGKLRGIGNEALLSIEGGTLNAAKVALSDTTSVVFNHGVANYVFAPRIVGTGEAVFVGGTGKTIFTADNTYTGPTQISGATLQLGNGGTTGAITADVVFVAGQGGMLAFNRSDTLTYGGTISGDGNVAQNGTGATVLTGNNTYTGATIVNAGTLIVDGSIANSTVWVNGGRLRGTGLLGEINALNGAIVEPGNSIGTLWVNRNFTLNPGAIFEVELNAAGQNDRVVVTGTVNLTGSTLRVLAEDGNYRARTEYVIVENAGADPVQGEFGEITTSLAFLTPTVLYDAGTGNDVVLFLTRNDSDFCAVARTRNECAVGRALDRFPVDNPLYVAVLQQSASGARQAFDALSGEIHATLAGVLADDSRYVREAVLGRLVQAAYTNNSGQVAALGSGGPQVAAFNTGVDARAMTLGSDEGKSLSAPPPSPGAAFWTRAYGAWGDFEGNGNAATADRDLGGFLSGIDAQIEGTWRAGFAAGGSWSNVSVDARHSHAEVESFSFAGYVGGMAGPLALRGGGAWSWSEVDTNRAVIFPGLFERQRASYDADTGQIFGEIALPLAPGGFAIEPFAGLAYVGIDADSFSESGGALSALNGGSDDEDVGYSTLGLRVATAMHWNTMLVIPKISAAWQHAFDDVTPGASLVFATTGIGFGIDGVPLAQDSLLLEAGLGFNLSPTATLGVFYSGQFADDVTDNAVKGRLTWLF